MLCNSIPTRIARPAQTKRLSSLARPLPCCPIKTSDRCTTNLAETPKAALVRHRRMRRRTLLHSFKARACAQGQRWTRKTSSICFSVAAWAADHLAQRPCSRSEDLVCERTTTVLVRGRGRQDNKAHKMRAKLRCGSKSCPCLFSFSARCCHTCQICSRFLTLTFDGAQRHCTVRNARPWTVASRTLSTLWRLPSTRMSLRRPRRRGMVEVFNAFQVIRAHLSCVPLSVASRRHG